MTDQPVAMGHESQGPSLLLVGQSASGNTGFAMWNNHIKVAVVILLHSPRLHCGTLCQARSLLYAIVRHCVGSRQDCAQFSCCRVTTLSNIEQHSLTLGLLEIIATLILAMLYIMPETGT